MNKIKAMKKMALFSVGAVSILAFVVACGSDDDEPAPSTSTTSIFEPTTQAPTTARPTTTTARPTTTVEPTTTTQEQLGIFPPELGGLLQDALGS